MKYKVIERISINYPNYFRRDVVFEKLDEAQAEMELQSNILHAACNEGKIQDYEVCIEATLN